MNRKKTLEALEEISDRHIQEAAMPPKKKKTYWVSAIAAVLAVALCVGVFAGPMRISAKAVALPGDNRLTARPDSDDYKNRDEYREASERWEAEQKQRDTALKNAAASLRDFFTKGSAEFLSTDGSENLLWSPINAYIGLAMVTELTGGESRQQILDLLGTADTDTLRKQVSSVWESVYQNRKNQLCTLANSLWLEEGLTYNQAAMDVLAYHYYASVYKGDLGSEKINKAIGAWLNNNTGGFLKDATKNIKLSPETVLALYSTIYFQAKWSSEFSPKNNTEDVFHAPDGDKTATFMNKKLAQMYYYWGDNFSAVALGLKNGSRMWFVLPDEGYTTADVLANEQYMQMVLRQEWENEKRMMVNLSVPKFDVKSSLNLKDGLQNMGVTDVFHEKRADFSEISSDMPIYLTAAKQSIRVEIDEEGVKAAAYIEFSGPTSSQPPEEIIDFVLDRPFLFMITSENLPLFAGCVNNP